MPRVQLNIPEELAFSTELDIRVSDLNYGNHLGNDRMVTLLHEARLRYLREFDLSEFNIGGLGLIVTDLVVSFKMESFFGDMLTFHVGLADFNKYGCDLLYRVVNQESEKLVAEAKTGVVFFDYDERKIAKIPKVFLQKCAPDQLA